MEAERGNKPNQEFQEAIDRYQHLYIRVQAFISDCNHPVPDYAATVAFGVSKVRLLHLVNDYYNTRKAA